MRTQGRVLSQQEAYGELEYIPRQDSNASSSMDDECTVSLSGHWQITLLTVFDSTVHFCRHYTIPLFLCRSLYVNTVFARHAAAILLLPRHAHRVLSVHYYCSSHVRRAAAPRSECVSAQRRLRRPNSPARGRRAIFLDLGV